MMTPWAVLLIILLIGLNISAAVDIIRAARRAWIRRAERRRQDLDQVDIVAQAIARCYGHGPIDVMDPAYQHEFRRDARAAIAAMGRR